MNGPVALAVNPTAGSGRGARAGIVVARRLAEAGLDVVPLEAAGAPQLRTLARSVLDRGATALVVVGGDGIVNLGVNLVAGSGVPLGIVAAGTGNDTAREAGLPTDDLAAAAQVIIDALACGRTRAVDAVRWTAGTTHGWFAGVLGAGFDALVNERANQWHRLRSRLRYDLAIARELPWFTPRPYLIELDGERHERHAVLVAVGNGPAYGGGMRICPDALMDDGMLDVLVAGPMSRRALVRLYTKVWSGAHLDHPAVQVFRARRVHLDSPGIVGYADGERLAPLPMTCEVVPSAVRLLAPCPGQA